MDWDGLTAQRQAPRRIRGAERDEVQAFYDAALAAGGKDNGAPGLRPHYHANYYGSYIIDPDGHNVEAVDAFAGIVFRHIARSDDQAMSYSLFSLTSGVVSSPFTQLRKLIAGIAPGHAKPIELTIGEPREEMPDFIAAKLDEATALYGKYPPIRGADEARKAISEWLSKRYTLPSTVDPEREVLMLSGSREGLFFACLQRSAARPSKGGRRS